MTHDLGIHKVSVEGELTPIILLRFLQTALKRATRRHKAQLARIGMSDVTRRRLGCQFWVSLVTATKPEQGASGSTKPAQEVSTGNLTP
jgi:hypothetical protein